MYLVTFVLSALSSPRGGLCLSPVTPSPSLHPVLVRWQSTTPSSGTSTRAPKPPVLLRNSNGPSPPPVRSVHLPPSLSSRLPPSPFFLLPSPPFFLLFLAPFSLPSRPPSPHAECSVCCMDVGWREDDAQGPPPPPLVDWGPLALGLCLIPMALCLIKAWHVLSEEVRSLQVLGIE